jgi:ribose-phosphate pyrophosphokinase
MTEPGLLLHFADEAPLAQRLAQALALPPHAVLLRGLQQPNPKLAPLLLAAAGAREAGARELTLVSPYLAYMRQDMAFTPGEVVSQRHLGALLAAHFDAVLTVDPHLHRVATMDEVVPGRRGVALTAAPLLGGHVKRQLPGALLPASGCAPPRQRTVWTTRCA